MSVINGVDLNKLASEVKDQVVAWRRHFHMNPEISFQEVDTSQYIYDTVSAFPNLVVTRPSKTSVMAVLKGDKPGKTIALRADMDALEMTEENSHEFVSKRPGAMHACGHDGHTAMLLGVTKIMSENKNLINGEVRFLFQHAEELFPGGAQEMCDKGVMDGVDLVLGCHLWAPIPVGKIGVCAGPMMASPDTFWLKIIGKGGHAALPHNTIDSIAIACQVVTNLQQIVSRNTDPLDNAVVTVSVFNGGTAHNIIPGFVDICGSVRTFDKNVRERMPKLIEQITKGVTEAHGATYELKYEFGYAPVINDAEVTKAVEEVLIENFEEGTVYTMPPNMGGEDFSAFQKKAPGTFYYVGAGNEEKGITYPHHHTKFDIDEKSLDIGVKAMLNAAFKFVG